MSHRLMHEVYFDTKLYAFLLLVCRSQEDSNVRWLTS